MGRKEKKQALANREAYTARFLERMEALFPESDVKDNTNVKGNTNHGFRRFIHNLEQTHHDVDSIVRALEKNSPTSMSMKINAKDYQEGFDKKQLERRKDAEYASLYLHTDQASAQPEIIDVNVEQMRGNLEQYQAMRDLLQICKENAEKLCEQANQIVNSARYQRDCRRSLESDTPYVTTSKYKLARIKSSLRELNDLTWIIRRMHYLEMTQSTNEAEKLALDGLLLSCAERMKERVDHANYENAVRQGGSDGVRKTEHGLSYATELDFALHEEQHHPKYGGYSLADRVWQACLGGSFLTMLLAMILLPFAGFPALVVLGITAAWMTGTVMTTLGIALYTAIDGSIQKRDFVKHEKDIYNANAKFFEKRNGAERSPVSRLCEIRTEKAKQSLAYETETLPPSTPHQTQRVTPQRDDARQGQTTLEGPSIFSRTSADSSSGSAAPSKEPPGPTKK